TLPWMKDAAAALEVELTSKYGPGAHDRLSRGLSQVGALWRAGDGDAAAFADFVKKSFAADSKVRNALFARMEFAVESLEGHMLEVTRDFKRQSELDLGEVYPFDEVMAGWDPSAHIQDDWFENKLAFVVLLNFPLTTLAERLEKGDGWSRQEWAEVRLAERFGKRIPADVNLAMANARADADSYIADYNIWMHHLVDAKGNRPFPPKMRLLSHWNLRDELKADYADPKTALAKQRTIQKVMERIVDQTIPAQVVNNPHVDWNPFTNEVTVAAVKDTDAPASAGLKASNAPEPDTRYAVWVKDFQAFRKADPYSPAAPTHIARKFDEERQIPEARLNGMLEAVLTSPLVPRVARLIEKRLGRPLEPFDVWYNGFRTRGPLTEAQLDEIVRKKYPTSAAYEKDIPNLLRKLGFPPDKADAIAKKIVVDPARGSGHAMGAARRADEAHLRTRVGKDGMDYKGFNIAVHEMGHNVEQVLSLNFIDHPLLAGVPNTAFTEALAFVFQNQDLELLGLAKADENARATEALNALWMTYEIAGVALVDNAVWHYLYDHPGATRAELKQATLKIARDVWNRYYAPVLGKKNVTFLAVYSHMINSFLYLADYPIGHLIAFQVERQMEKAGSIGPEFIRIATQGRVTPDLWMRTATGKPVGPEALLSATAEALAKVEKK
ncbi:MAG TPA: hypothetical protein VF580_02100, partial [Thermoanaerobaculia bacterium]